MNVILLLQLWYICWLEGSYSRSSALPVTDEHIARSPFLVMPFAPLSLKHDFMIAYRSEIAIKNGSCSCFFFSGLDVCLLKTLLGRQCLPANTSRNEFKRENGIDPWIKLIYGLLYAIHLHPNPSRLHLLWRIEWPLDFTKKLVIISFHKILP